eukprot:scaffold32640_cov101-Isochrysis_galbana.AAC.4
MDVRSSATLCGPVAELHLNVSCEDRIAKVNVSCEDRIGRHLGRTSRQGSRRAQNAVARARSAPPVGGSWPGSGERTTREQA